MRVRFSRVALLLSLSFSLSLVSLSSASVVFAANVGGGKEGERETCSARFVVSPFRTSRQTRRTPSGKYFARRRAVARLRKRARFANDRCAHPPLRCPRFLTEVCARTLFAKLRTANFRRAADEEERVNPMATKPASDISRYGSETPRMQPVVSRSG